MKRKNTRSTYRLRNWGQYNKALVRRGSLTLWVTDDTVRQWRNHQRTGRRGVPQTYSDTAILCMATLCEVYRLPLRATEGLMRSVVGLLGLTLRVPSYTTLCRRRRALSVSLPRHRRDEPLHLVVDSTGVKIHGEGEWKVRRYGWSKRRTWRKLHLGVDEQTGELAAAVVTTNDFGDGQVLADLLGQVSDELRQVTGDGGYDDRQCYDAIGERKARAVIPPQQGARIWRHGNRGGERHARDENLRYLRAHGRAKWKRDYEYHRRSLAEVAVFRLKQIFGASASARSFEGQASQLLVRCAALNRMTHEGMPDGYKVAA
ncbi:MAG: IS5 family transposase [Acidobacteria bacterium]|nr:IS5 family transposase [Acidobacteriota bacterium]